jgi:hypothetical protein
MSAIRQEIQGYIDNIPDGKLEALKPLLSVLVNDTIVIETNLTDEEKKIIARGREEYTQGGFVPLSAI